MIPDGLPTDRMTVDRFEAWLGDGAPPGRYELSCGLIVAMAAERVAHNRVKVAVLDALRAAAHGLDCEALADGMAVRVDEWTLREPDAALRCGPRLPADAVRYDDPVVVVEVTSPSTASTDMAEKLVEYARLPSLAHYVIVALETRMVVHHRRTGDGFATTLHPGGRLRLDPPGIEVDLGPILEAGA